jgi:hypothetical protein
MYFFKGTVLKVVLPLVLALNIFPGTFAEAAAIPTVQLQTYGVLPVMVVNLTQSPINYNISFSNASAYTQAQAPVAIGLHGWSYIASGNATALFNNPTTPNTTPSGVTNPSLSPAVFSAPGVAPVYSLNQNYSFLNSFALFPSWNNRVSFPDTNYLTAYVAPGATTLGAAIGPSGNVINNIGPINSTAYGQSMANTSTCNINLNLQGTSGVATYQVQIVSEGGQTGAYQPAQSNGNPIDWWDTTLKIIGDIDSLATKDPVAIGVGILGIPDTIRGIADSYNTNSNLTNKPYPATYKGIEVAATAVSLPTGATFSSTNGNSDYSVYETNSPQPDQDNYLFFATWRQKGPGNTSMPDRLSADNLVVVVINKGLITANQTQQFLNNNALTQSAMHYKPTKEQAEDSLKILAILTAISKKSPQDAKTIFDLFGFNGEYEKTKNNPNAVANAKVKLKEVLEKYQRELPVIEPYLVKLAQKR